MAARLGKAELTFSQDVWPTDFQLIFELYQEFGHKFFVAYARVRCLAN